jgi:hypothetical protein
MVWNLINVSESYKSFNILQRYWNLIHIVEHLQCLRTIVGFQDSFRVPKNCKFVWVDRICCIHSWSSVSLRARIRWKCTVFYFFNFRILRSSRFPWFFLIYDFSITLKIWERNCWSSISYSIQFLLIRYLKCIVLESQKYSAKAQSTFWAKVLVRKVHDNFNRKRD